MRANKSCPATALALAAALATTLIAPDLPAQTKVECVQAFADAQLRRNALELRASLERFTLCAREECPAPVRADCAAGLEQVTRDLPTVVLGARDAGARDIPDVAVFVDGAPVAIDVRGASVPIDPGQHVFRFEHPDYVSAEESSLIRAGEHNRSLVLTLRRKDGSDLVLPTGATEGPPPDRGEGRRSAGYVVGGIGLAALATGAGFGIAAAVRCGGLLREPCDAVAEAPVAEQEATRSSVVTQTWVANIGFGVGVAAVGTAAVLLFWPTSSNARATSLRASPRAGGGGIEVVGRF